MDKDYLPPWYPLIDDKLKTVPACIRTEVREAMIKTRQMENAVIAILGSMPEQKAVIRLSKVHDEITKIAQAYGGKIGVSFVIGDDNDTVTISLEPSSQPTNVLPFVQSRRK